MMKGTTRTKAIATLSLTTMFVLGADAQPVTGGNGKEPEIIQATHRAPKDTEKTSVITGRNASVQTIDRIDQAILEFYGVSSYLRAQPILENKAVSVALRDAIPHLRRLFPDSYVVLEPSYDPEGGPTILAISIMFSGEPEDAEAAMDELHALNGTWDASARHNTFFSLEFV